MRSVGVVFVCATLVVLLVGLVPTLALGDVASVDSRLLTRTLTETDPADWFVAKVLLQLDQAERMEIVGQAAAERVGATPKKQAKATKKATKSSAADTERLSPATNKQKFERFVAVNKRQYTDPIAASKALKTFSSNREKIAAMNDASVAAGGPKVFTSLSPFADRDRKQFRAEKFGRKGKQPTKRVKHARPSMPIPRTVADALAIEKSRKSRFGKTPTVEQAWRAAQAKEAKKSKRALASHDKATSRSMLVEVDADAAAGVAVEQLPRSVKRVTAVLKTKAKTATAAAKAPVKAPAAVVKTPAAPAARAVQASASSSEPRGTGKRAGLIFGGDGKGGGKSGAHGGATGGDGGSDGKSGAHGGNTGGNGSVGGSGRLGEGFDRTPYTGRSAFSDNMVPDHRGTVADNGKGQYFYKGAVLTPSSLTTLLVKQGVPSGEVAMALQTMLPLRLAGTGLMSTWDQGACASCWAHAAFQNMVAIHGCFYSAPGAIAVSPSVQQLIDCVRTDDSDGCNGGTPMDAIDYFTENDAVHMMYYPNSQPMKSGFCQARLLAQQQRRQFFARIGHGWSMVTKACAGPTCEGRGANEIEMMKAMLASGRTMIAYVDADNWQMYTHGLFPVAMCSADTERGNHIVEIVGWRTDQNTPPSAMQNPFIPNRTNPTMLPYWIVKNTWQGWGEGGFIRIPFGVNACGISNFVVWANVDKSAPGYHPANRSGCDHMYGEGD